MTDVRILTESLGGSPLSLLLQRGGAPTDWHPAAPSDVEGWRRRAAELAGSRDWTKAWEAIAPAIAGAAEAQGPRLASVSLTEPAQVKGGKREPTEVALRTFGPDGGAPLTLVRGTLAAKGRMSPMPFDAPSWSGDGSVMAFAGVKGEKLRQIYLVGADGKGLHAVPGTRGGADPVLSPDGSTLAFSRSRLHLPRIDFKHPFKSLGGGYSSTTTWTVDLKGDGKPRRLTPWRNGLGNEPDSFSPDGAVLALTKHDDRLEGPRVVLARLDGSGSTDLVRLASEAAFSADGSHLAFVSYADRDVVQAEENHDYAVGEIYTVRSDGSELRRITRSKGVEEASPSWDPSGQRIAFVRARGSTGFVPELDQLFPYGNAIVAVNADGSCPTTVASAPRVAFYGVAWQPGPGRESPALGC